MQIEMSCGRIHNALRGILRDDDRFGPRGSCHDSVDGECGWWIVTQILYVGLFVVVRS